MTPYYAPKLNDPNFKTNNPHNQMLKTMMFARNYDELKKYTEYMKTIQDPKQHIIRESFDKSTRTNFIADLDNETVLSKNLFEYVRPPYMDQYVVWTLNKNKTHDEIVALLMDFIGSDDYILWTNDSTIYCSIPQIKHFHLIISRNDNVKINMKLEKLIIIGRHGPREPIEYLPNLHWNKNAIDDKKELSRHAHLTKKGELFCKENGKFMRKYYDEFCNDLNDQNILVASSGMTRTTDSAIHFMSGFMPDLCTDGIVHVKELSGYGSLTKEEIPEFYKVMSDVKSSITESIEFSKLYDFINDKIGLKLASLHKCFDIHSSLKCYELETDNFGDIISTDTMNYVNELATEFYHELFAFNNRFYCNRLSQDIHGVIDSLVDNDNIKFAYLASHDSLVFPLAKYHIGNNTRLHIPNFCSNVRYEVWSEDQTNKKIIRIYYDELFITEYPISFI